eukprot:363811-Chlamydomonas_euryale.AAC.14
MAAVQQEAAAPTTKPATKSTKRAAGVQTPELSPAAPAAEAPTAVAQHNTHGSHDGSGASSSSSSGPAGQGGGTGSSNSKDGGGASSADTAAGDCPYIGLRLSDNFFSAQNLWDASMAYAISGALHDAGAGGLASGAPPALVVHVCGAAHCERKLGIPEHLARYAPEACVAVVLCVPTAGAVAARAGNDNNAWRGPSPARLAEMAKRADFFVLTDGTQQRSFDSQHPV